MSKIAKIPLCPATKWVVATAEAHGVVVLQFDFIATSDENAVIQDHSPHFVLSPEDAQALASALQEAACEIKAAERRHLPETLQ